MDTNIWENVIIIPIVVSDILGGEYSTIPPTQDAIQLPEKADTINRYNCNCNNEDSDTLWEKFDINKLRYPCDLKLANYRIKVLHYVSFRNCLLLYFNCI